MEVRAKTKYVLQSPRKLRMVRDLLLDREVNEAMQVLRAVPKRGCKVIEKTMKSALSNANQMSGNSSWRVKNVLIDQGPSLKRFRAATMGRAFPVKKRMSHVIVILEDSLERGKNGTKG